MHGWGMEGWGDRDSHQGDARIAGVFATRRRDIIRSSIFSISNLK